MIPNQIDELIKEFNQQASKMKSKLTDILVFVSGGKVPSQEDMNQFDADMASLRQKYSAVYQLAKSEVSEDELPSDGSPIDMYAEAVKNSRSRIVKEKVAKAQKILDEFVRVRSKIEELRTALVPFQDKAKEVFNKINESNIDAFETELKAPNAFLTALYCENPFSEEGTKNVEEVRKLFSPQISNGLVAQQYYISDSDEDTLIEDQRLNISKENKTTVTARENKEEDNCNDTKTSMVEKKTAPTETLDDHEQLAEDTKTFPIQNKVKKGTPSANSFRNDVMKLSKANKKIRFLFPLLTNLGVLSKEQAYISGICMDVFEESDKDRNEVYNGIDLLVNKGYLACVAYGEQSVERAYYLSGYSYECQRKESIRKMRGFWGVSFGEYRFTFDEGVEKDTLTKALANNDALLQYFYAMRELLSKADFAEVQQSIRWTVNHYQVAVLFDGGKYISYLADIDSNLAEISAENILVCGDYVPSDISYNPKTEKIFVFSSGTVKAFQSEKGSFQLIENDTDDTSEDEEQDSVTENGVEDSETNDDHGNVASIKEPVDIEQNSQAHSDESKSVIEATDIDTDNNKSEISITPSDLLGRSEAPSDDDFKYLIENSLQKNVTTKEQLTSSITQSAMLSYSAALQKKSLDWTNYSMRIRTATHLLVSDAEYSSENLTKIFADVSDEDRPMMFAAYIFALMAPAMPYDYALKSQTEMFLEQYDKYFPGLNAFKPFFNLMMKVKDASVTGFTPSAVASIGSDAENQKFLNELKSRAKENLNVHSPKTRMTALPKLYNRCFGKDSAFYGCMDIIASSDPRGANQEAMESIEIVLLDFCDSQNDVFTINQEKVEERLNKEWDEINSKNKFKLEYDARAQAIRQFVNRLEIMVSWLEYENNVSKKKADIKRLRDIREDILKQISDLQKDISWRNIQNANILSWMLQYMKVYLSGRSSRLKIYSELLLTGILSQDDDGKPDIDKTMENVRFYEPWRNILRHMTSERKSPEEMKSEILGDDLENADASRKDNLHQLNLLGKLLGSNDDDYVVTENQIEEARASAEEKTRKFNEELELAYTYNRINENEKEAISDILAHYQPKFVSKGDFACYRDFLKALRDQIDYYAEKRKNAFRAQLDDRLKKDPKAQILLEADKALKEKKNFAVTEEYINRYDMGDTEIEEELDSDSSEFDFFNDFLSPDVYDKLYQECKRAKGYSFKKYAKGFFEKNRPKNWTKRLIDDSEDMINSWPGRRNSATSDQVRKLFECLGFDVQQAFKATVRTEELFQVVVTPTPKNRADYVHPIAAFGTQVKSPINAIMLYGNFTEKELVDRISDMDLGGISLVFVDQPFTTSSRRLIGEIFHNSTSGQNPFLLIDQVLFLYLAMHQRTERMPAMLKCTLPYTTYQPFVRDGGSTADEMFCGRKSELKTIMDPNGACVVYGGRQLGKTALLERAESRCSNPANKEYAVYSSILKISSESEVARKLISDIALKTEKKIDLKETDTIKGICEQIAVMFQKNQISTLFLFIDEVDTFLAAIAADDYMPIQPLVELKRATKNNFKFVITGLHNVCRAEKATEHNGIFGQLGTPLCIKPLTPSDALTLIQRPLRYLGFEIDKYPHLLTILTNTNYYPGILQFFGYMLVETLTSQYSRYYSATKGNPPFTLQDEQLGAVMNSADLNRSIKDKFRLSLELDQRYFMLARCITMLYHLYEEDRAQGSWMGFQVEEIMEMAKTYDIHCLSSATFNDYVNLLDEMLDMGILSRPSNGHYRLRRSSFVDIIGENMDDLEKDIINNNSEVRNNGSLGI